MKKRKIRAVTSSVLAFLIAVCSAILVILLSLAATVFHGNFILQKLDQKFCSAMADTITQSMKDVAASSSLEDSVFDGVITTSAVSRDMSLKARETLAGVSSSFDSTPPAGIPDGTFPSVCPGTRVSSGRRGRSQPFFSGCSLRSGV